MIDYRMYRRLHPASSVFRFFEVPLHYNIPEISQGDDLPDDDILACFPPAVHAFRFGTKTWGMAHATIAT